MVCKRSHKLAQNTKNPFPYSQKHINRQPQGRLLTLPFLQKHEKATLKQTQVPDYCCALNYGKSFYQRLNRRNNLAPISILGVLGTSDSCLFSITGLVTGLKVFNKQVNKQVIFI